MSAAVLLHKIYLLNYHKETIVLKFVLTNTESTFFHIKDILDYFVPKHLSKQLLKASLNFISALHMSLKDSLQWLGEVMAEIGPAHLQKHKKWSIFDIKQANAITDYLKIRYGFLFTPNYFFVSYLLENIF